MRGRYLSVSALIQGTRSGRVVTFDLKASLSWASTWRADVVGLGNRISWRRLIDKNLAKTRLGEYARNPTPLPPEQESLFGLDTSAARWRRYLRMKRRR